MKSLVKRLPFQSVYQLLRSTIVLLLVWKFYLERESSHVACGSTNKWSCVQMMWWYDTSLSKIISENIFTIKSSHPLRNVTCTGMYKMLHYDLVKMLFWPLCLFIYYRTLYHPRGSLNFKSSAGIALFESKQDRAG